MAISKSNRQLAGALATVALVVGISTVAFGVSDSVTPTASIPTPTPSVSVDYGPSRSDMEAWREDQICREVKALDSDLYYDENLDYTNLALDSDYNVSIRPETFKYYDASGWSHREQPADADTAEVREVVSTHCPAQLVVMDKKIAQIEKRDDAVKQAEKAKKAGLLVSDGSHVVGKDMKPGTWHTVRKGLIKDCYWERTSGSGNIIDNHFGNSTRMTVTVRSGEIFKTEDCGSWKKS